MTTWLAVLDALTEALAATHSAGMAAGRDIHRTPRDTVDAEQQAQQYRAAVDHQNETVQELYRRLYAWADQRQEVPDAKSPLTASGD